MIGLKTRPNDRNMSTQHIATLLGATCYVRLAALLRPIATCWVLLAQTWPFSNLCQQFPTCRNTSQRGGQTHTTCCNQKCCDMLRWHVAIFGRDVWSCSRVYFLQAYQITQMLSQIDYACGTLHLCSGNFSLS